MLPGGSSELTRYDDLSQQRQASEKGLPMVDQPSPTASLMDVLAYAEKPVSELEEVRQMCAAVTDFDYSFGEQQTMAFACISMRQQQRGLSILCHAGEMSREKYLEAVASLLESFKQQNFRLLGSARYTALFGSYELDPAGLIDRETFMAADFPSSSFVRAAG